jgi:hypothetical protein
VCHLIYTTTGSPGFSKERVEVHGGGVSAVLEDFRTLVLDDGRHRRRKRLWQADKGHGAAVSSFLTSILEGKPMPIAAGELFETMNVTLAAAQAGG